MATNDAHYLTKADARIQDVLMSIQMGKTVDDPTRMKFETQEFYIKDADEMAALFPEHPEALANTVKIAERCQVEFEFGKYHLPNSMCRTATPRSNICRSCAMKASQDAIRTTTAPCASVCSTRST